MSHDWHLLVDWERCSMSVAVSWKNCSKIHIALIPSDEFSLVYSSNYRSSWYFCPHYFSRVLTQSLTSCFYLRRFDLWYLYFHNFLFPSHWSNHGLSTLWLLCTLPVNINIRVFKQAIPFVVVATAAAAFWKIVYIYPAKNSYGGINCLLIYIEKDHVL